MFLAFAAGGELSVAAPGQPARVQHDEAGRARSIGSAGGTIHVMLVELK